MLHGPPLPSLIAVDKSVIDLSLLELDGKVIPRFSGCIGPDPTIDYCSRKSPLQLVQNGIKAPQTASLLCQILTQVPVAVEEEKRNDDEDFEKQRRSAQSRFRTRRWELLPFLVEEEKNDEDDCCINDDFARDERKEESTAEGMDTR